MTTANRFLSLLCFLALLSLTLASCIATAPQVAKQARGCAYPLTAQMFSGYTIPNPNQLQDLAHHDLVVLNMDAPPTTVHALRDAGVTVLAYVPAGYWWSEPLRQQTHRNAVLALLVEDDWLHDAAGQRVQPWQDQPLLNHSNPLVAAKIAAYLKPRLAHFDGVHFDVMDATLGYVGANVDMDQDGVNDRQQRSLAEIDAMWRRGLTIYAAEFDTIQGNAAWSPATPESQSAFHGLIAGALVEDGVATKYRDATTGQWLPSGPAALDWHLAQAQRWTGDLYAFGDDLLTDRYWGQYITTLPEARRFSLALALLTDSYLQLINPSTVEWCDECGVRNGTTARSAAANDWLGCPLGGIHTDGDVLWREFQNGAAYLNIRSTSAQIQPPEGFSKIRGWYDPQFNAGGPWDGSLEPYGARILWRKQAPASPSPTPSPPPTPDLPLRVQLLETRVTELEATH